MTAQYETINLGISDLERISLPKFQRGFVWTNAKKNEFVETLHKGFPFGALLVYPESNAPDSRLLLLDGQQRLSTIKQYRDNPLLFWKPNNREEYLRQYSKMREILAGLNVDPDELLPEQRLDELVSKKIELADWSDEVAPYDKDARQLLRKCVNEMQEKIKEYVDLESLGILAIKFTGGKDQIAAVFANLNKGGMPLSKYEIFSAAWANEEIALLPAGESELQDEILENVKSYYSAMENDAQFELNNFSEDELTLNRSITLSEFGVALGMLVQSRLSALVGESSNAANEVGFGLLGIATGIDNRKLGTLNEYMGSIEKDLQCILEKTVNICTNLQDVFSKMLKRICARKNNEYATGLSTTFKTLSYFAALWNLDPSSAEYKNSLRNISAYYVFDSCAKVWSSHGDQRLLDYYPGKGKRDYLKPVDKDVFEEAFSRWLADTTPGINFSKEVQALVTIHANLSYLSGTIPYGESFELEHIIAKKRLNDAEESSNASSRRIMGGSLGNCMYLPKLINNKKKDKTLYEAGLPNGYSEFLEKSFYFSESEFAEIAVYLSEHEYDLVNQMIARRGKAVASDLVSCLLQMF